MRHISNKFEVSTAFWFRVNLRHVTDRQTDMMQHIIAQIQVHFGH